MNGIKEATSKTNKTRQLSSLVTEQNKSGIWHRSSSEAASASGQRNSAQQTQKNPAQNRTSATKRSHSDTWRYKRRRNNKQTLGHRRWHTVASKRVRYKLLRVQGSGHGQWCTGCGKWRAKSSTLQTHFLLHIFDANSEVLVSSPF
jgi:hypothetical protein